MSDDKNEQHEIMKRSISCYASMFKLPLSFIYMVV